MAKEWRQSERGDERIAEFLECRGLRRGGLCVGRIQPAWKRNQRRCHHFVLRQYCAAATKRQRASADQCHVYGRGGRHWSIALSMALQWDEHRSGHQFKPYIEQRAAHEQWRLFRGGD